MREERENPVWPWVVVLLIGLPVLYVASFGPACWLARPTDRLWSCVATVYGPLGRIAVDGPGVFREPLAWYECLLADPFMAVNKTDLIAVPIGPNEPWGMIARSRHGRSR